MANTIRTKLILNMTGYVEFDYKNPIVKQRIRRKISATPSQSDLLKSLLEQIMDNNWDLDTTVNYIRTNNFYRNDSDYYEKAIRILYFNYCNENANEDEREKQKTIFLDENFPLDNYNATFCFLGKAGVGKSTIIKKISCFWDTDDVSFPFTDTSRTSTFPTDYCFVPKTENFKFVATFIPQSVINLNIEECMDRGVNKLLELINNSEINKSTSIDTVMTSFILNPAQSFDIRYSLGRYIKTTSLAYSKPENADLISFWSELYKILYDITTEIINNDSTPVHQETSYYQLKYSDALKQGDENNKIKELHQKAVDQIQCRMQTLQSNLISSIENNESVTDVKFDMANETVPSCTCTIRHQNDEAFYKFIRAFTTKKASEFGNSFLNIVDHLRIELPTNQNIVLPQKDFSFVIQDTIGIAHSNDENGGFENSTRLQMENVDAVVIIDDSRMNGDNNTTIILSHLLARISPHKIYFGFTFFDDLTKEDFDDEDDIDSQRISYLIATETQIIKTVVKDPEQSRILLNKLNSNNSFFIKGLMDNDYVSINSLLKILIEKKIYLSKRYRIFKPDPNKPFVIYDYKKIPLLYQQAISAFEKQQTSIYLENPPHYKTTEALTNRLSQGISFFSGARTLHPLDDLYNSIVQSLSKFIDQPAKVNFTVENAADSEYILGELKTRITESIRESLNSKFFNKNAIFEWKKLYYLSGIGSDQMRRSGILETESTIAPGLNEYLNSTVQEHIIDVIEESFTSKIDLFEHLLEIDDE